MINPSLRLLRRILPSPVFRLLRRRSYRPVARCAQGMGHEIDRLVERGHLVVQVKGDYATWLHLQCPCHCGAVLHVNLMVSADPAWHLTVDRRGNATIQPSLVVTTCASHFWITAGRVYWVQL